jgi:hypothetical protein
MHKDFIRLRVIICWNITVTYNLRNVVSPCEVINRRTGSSKRTLISREARSFILYSSVNPHRVMKLGTTLRISYRQKLGWPKQLGNRKFEVTTSFTYKSLEKTGFPESRATQTWMSFLLRILDCNYTLRLYLHNCIICWKCHPLCRHNSISFNIFVEMLRRVAPLIRSRKLIYLV